MTGTWTGDGAARAMRGATRGAVGTPTGRTGGRRTGGRRTGRRRTGGRLAGSLGGLAAVGALLARTAPHDWPHGLGDLPRWLAAPPPEARLLALVTVAAYGCLAWLALALLAAAAGSGVRVAPAAVRRAAERVLGLTLATAAAGVLAAGPALADGPRVRPQSGAGPFDRPVATAVLSAQPRTVTPPAPPARPQATPRVTPSRAAAAAAAPTAARPARGAEGAVVVVRGDTLWDIAARHLGPGATPGEVAAEWPRWYAANRAVIGPDPGRILPGQRLARPAGGAR